MPAEPENVLLIMSDEHRLDALRCAGHDVVSTPVLDRLAAEGTRFRNAYCPSPLCAPCRASFVTGRYVHEIGAGDNAASYGGDPPTWGPHFESRGIDVTTIGGLDFQPGVRGFEEQLLAGYRGSPDVNGLERDPPIVRDGARERITNAGATDEPGDHEKDDGWTLWLNYHLPHFPLTAEREYYERYSDVYELPYDYPASDDHPVLTELRDHFDGRGVDEETLRRTRRAYYALCTRLDEEIGRVLDALDRLAARLRERVDPETVDRRARADQQRRRERPVEEWWGA